MPEAIHVTADKRRLLILHGDEFDGVVLYAKWLAFLGDSAYVLLLKLNRLLNWVRRKRGLPYWSLSSHLKKKVKNAVQFISSFEEVVAHAAHERGAHGVVCGHIHSPEICQIGAVTYYNDGDWVESCTALVEHPDGRMEIIDWAEHQRTEAEQGRSRRHRRKKERSTREDRRGHGRVASPGHGVVRSISTTVDHLRGIGHQVEVIHPSRFRTLPCPTYPENGGIWMLPDGRQVTRGF